MTNFYNAEETAIIQRAIAYVQENYNRFDIRQIVGFLAESVNFEVNTFTEEAPGETTVIRRIKVFPGYFWVYDYGYADNRHKEVICGRGDTIISTNSIKAIEQLPLAIQNCIR